MLAGMVTRRAADVGAGGSTVAVGDGVAVGEGSGVAVSVGTGVLVAVGSGVLVAVAVGCGVAVAVGIGVLVSVGRGVDVAVAVGAGVLVAVAVAVGELVAVAAAVGVLVAVGSGVLVVVGSGVAVAVAVATGVAVGRGICVGVAVKVGRGVLDAVGAGVAVGTGVSVGVGSGVAVAVGTLIWAVVRGVAVGGASGETGVATSNAARIVMGEALTVVSAPPPPARLPTTKPSITLAPTVRATITSAVRCIRPVSVPSRFGQGPETPSRSLFRPGRSVRYSPHPTSRARSLDSGQDMATLLGAAGRSQSTLRPPMRTYTAMMPHERMAVQSDNCVKRSSACCR